jgi:septum formation protein
MNPPAHLGAMPCGVPPPVVLASTSERRSRLLARMGVAFEAVDPAVDEDAITADGPEATARARAEAKARAVAWARPEAVVIAADTVVALEGGEMLPKARDAAEVAAFVGMLAGTTHTVVTAVSIVHPGDEAPAAVADVARVTFRPLAQEEVAAYAASGEGVGKAGGYAVQGRAGAFVTSIKGDVETVVGLPTRVVRELLCAE